MPEPAYTLTETLSHTHTHTPGETTCRCVCIDAPQAASSARGKKRFDIHINLQLHALQSNTSHFPFSISVYRSLPDIIMTQHKSGV